MRGREERKEEYKRRERMDRQRGGVGGCLLCLISISLQCVVPPPDLCAADGRGGTEEYVISM